MTAAPHAEALKRLRIVVRAAQRHSAWIERQCGISGAQLWALAELSEAPGLRVGQLAERMVMQQPTVSNLLDSLEKRDLVVKQRIADDQRVVTVTLTQDGIDMLARAPMPLHGMLPASLRRMDEKRLAELNRGLAALIAEIDMSEEAYGLQPLPFTV